MNRKVYRHVDRLIQVWSNFPIISYSLGANRIWSEIWLLRPATIEDAPELFRVLRSSRQALVHDFGPVPCLMNDDAAVVNIARRRIADYDEQLRDREIKCSRLLALLDMSEDNHAVIAQLAMSPDTALAVA